MKALDFLEPLPVQEPHSLLLHARPWLVGRVPVAFSEAGAWKIIHPSDAVCVPDSRQLQDVPSRPLLTYPASEDLDLERIASEEVWGVVQDERLVGRIERTRLLADLANVAMDDTGEALAFAARDGLMPKLLHDLANALFVAGTWEADNHDDPSEAIRHAQALVRHMRSLYERRAPDTSTVRIPKLLRSMQTMLDVAARPASLALDVDVGSAVRAHPWRLESALLNLVLNASELATRVRVSASEDDEHVVLVVEDDGPGLPQLVASPTSREPGRGHGLASVRRQVLWMGGEWELTASPLGGARVALRLPRATS